MARGGINKVIVQKAREALLARGENPSIDAVRIELGNTGSKTTIHRYLKEIEDFDPRPKASKERLSDELSELVERLLTRMMEEGGEAITYAQSQFDNQRVALETHLETKESELSSLQRDFDSQKAALAAQTGELQTCQTTLQTEITRNARISQNCLDLELRIREKDEQIQSLEEKHRHARDAIEHYRHAVKEQREQEQRRHESQIQQVQQELSQLQQIQAIKQDELTRLNRDNERLLSEARQHAKAAAVQEDSINRLSGEIGKLKMSAAKTEGAKEMLKEQIAHLRADAKRQIEKIASANEQAADARRLLEETQAEVQRLQGECE